MTIIKDRFGKPWFVPLEPTAWEPFTGVGYDNPPEVVRRERRRDGDRIRCRPQWRWSDGHTVEGLWR